MKIKVASFTAAGKKLAESLFGSWQRDTIEYRFAGIGKEPAISLEDFTAQAFEENAALVFIGAMGIAVRSIAPHIKSKLTDPPVLVMDEKGKYVIPVLSGHVGGAIELAGRISAVCKAETVITTATDTEGVFAGDVYAKEHDLYIINKDAIVTVNARSLRKEEIRIRTSRDSDRECADVLIWLDEDKEPDIGASALILKPKRYVLGIGCKKGKTYEEITKAVSDFMKTEAADMSDICALCSIDLKRNEVGLIDFADRNRLPFVTFSAEELNGTEGDFSSSDFVAKITGVDCICERAAVCMSVKLDARPGRMIRKKTVYDGITLSLVKRDYRWEETK